MSWGTLSTGRWMTDGSSERIPYDVRCRWVMEGKHGRSTTIGRTGHSRTVYRIRFSQTRLLYLRSRLRIPFDGRTRPYESSPWGTFMFNKRILYTGIPRLFLSFFRLVSLISSTQSLLSTVNTLIFLSLWSKSLYFPFVVHVPTNITLLIQKVFLNTTWSSVSSTKELS